MSYKDYEIEDFEGMFSVFYCGDEIVFDTVDDAKQFIDEIS